MSECRTVLNLNFLSPICSKFSVEYDWNRKISQIRTHDFFWKKFNFCKIGKGGKFAVQMRIKWYIFFEMFFFHLNWGFAKNQNNFKFREVGKFDRIFFQKIRLSSFWKASLTKFQGGNYPCDSQVSCWISFDNCVSGKLM